MTGKTVIYGVRVKEGLRMNRVNHCILHNYNPETQLPHPMEGCPSEKSHQLRLSNGPLERQYSNTSQAISASASRVRRCKHSAE